MIKLTGSHIFRFLFFCVIIFFIVNNLLLKLFLMLFIIVIPLIQFKYDNKTNLNKKLLWIIANLDPVIMTLIFLIYLVQEKFSINYFGFIITGLLIYFTGKTKKKN